MYDRRDPTWRGTVKTNPVTGDPRGIWVAWDTPATRVFARGARWERPQDLARITGSPLAGALQETHRFQVGDRVARVGSVGTIAARVSADRMCVCWDHTTTPTTEWVGDLTPIAPEPR